MEIKADSDVVVAEKLKKICFRIKILRQERRIQQTELAQAVGISQTHLSNIENGKSIVTLENLLKIKSALGCNVQDLFGEEEQAQTKKSYTVQDVLDVLEIMNKK